VSIIVEHGKTVTFPVTPANTNYVVDKWTIPLLQWEQQKRTGIPHYKKCQKNSSSHSIKDDKMFLGWKMTLQESFENIKAEYVISLKGNQHPDAERRGCCSHKVIAVGFNTLCYDTIGIKSSARISNRYTGM